MATRAATRKIPRTSPDAAGLSDLVGLQGLTGAQLRALLGATREMADHPGKYANLLAGRIIGNLFFEDSTRTRTSFSVAAQRLGAGLVDVMGATSSVKKGETLIDTARNVEAMGVAALVVRARQSGAAELIARAVACPVINAGDGRHEHPTQGLLDAYTISQSFDRLDGFDLKDLKVAIVGDVAASRVARSAIAALTTLGARVVCVGPPALCPKGLGALGVAVSHDLDALLRTLDVVMMLRIQFERYAEGAPGNGEPIRRSPIAGVREYREMYALTPSRAARLKERAIVMHPGPINRGIELDAEVADGPRSVILKQVANGVSVRMAVLKMLAGSSA